MTKKQRLQDFEAYMKKVLIFISVILGVAYLVFLLASGGSEEVLLIGTGSAIAFLFYIFIDYIISKSFYALALDKGYFSYCYFWYCFILGPVGYIMVAAMPDRGHRDEAPLDVADVRNTVSKKTDSTKVNTSEAQNEAIDPQDKADEIKNKIISAVLIAIILIFILIAIFS